MSGVFLIIFLISGLSRFSASSAKSDIYAIGMLLNVMITRHFQKTAESHLPIVDI